MELGVLICSKQPTTDCCSRVNLEVATGNQVATIAVFINKVVKHLYIAQNPAALRRRGTCSTSAALLCLLLVGCCVLAGLR
jgi:hypothetical protein